MIHPSGTKMYRDLKTHLLRSSMKKDIGHYVTQCLVCYQVKAEHRLSVGKLQSLSVLVWKWENTRSQAGHDAIWVVVDRLTKAIHFLPIHTTRSRDKCHTLMRSFAYMECPYLSSGIKILDFFRCLGRVFPGFLDTPSRICLDSALHIILRVMGNHKGLIKSSRTS